MISMLIALLAADWMPSVKARAIECSGVVTVLVDGKKDNEFPVDSLVYAIDDAKESVAMFYPEVAASDDFPFRPDQFEVVCGPSCKVFWKSTSIYISGTNLADERTNFELDRINGTLGISEVFYSPVLESERKELVERKHQLICKPTAMPVPKSYKTRF